MIQHLLQGSLCTYDNTTIPFQESSSIRLSNYTYFGCSLCQVRSPEILFENKYYARLESYHQRPTFDRARRLNWYRMAPKGYEEPSDEFVAAMLRLVAQNRTLVIAGDSLSLHSTGYAICEIMRAFDASVKFDARHEYKERVTVLPDAPMHISNFTLTVAKSILEPVLQRVAAAGLIPLADKLILEKLSEVKIKIYYVGYHFHPARFPFFLDRLVDGITSEFDGIALVFNRGIWVNDEGDYDHSIGWDIRMLGRVIGGHNYVFDKTMAPPARMWTDPNVVADNTPRHGWTQQKRNTVFFRETTAQHFPTSNGYFEGKVIVEETRCTAIADMETAARRDWRNILARKHVALMNEKLAKLDQEKAGGPDHAGPPQIHILPLWNLTAELWDFHAPMDLTASKGSNVALDCTHFSFMPTLWQPFFRGIANKI